MTSDERAILQAGYTREQRDQNMTVGDPTTGGYGVPTDFSKQLVDRLEQSSAIRGAGATVISTSAGNPINFPVVTEHSDAQGALGEESGPDPDSDTFDQVELGAFKYGSLQKVSIELLQDNNVNLEAYLANELGRKIGRKTGAKYAVGGGTTEPTGLFVAADTIDTEQSHVIGPDDVLDLIYAVEPQYRQGGKFILNDGIVKLIRKLKFTISGEPVAYIWQPSFQAGQPDTLLGYNLYPEVAASSDGTASGALVACFGDISRFYIREAGGVQFLRLNERFMDDMQVGFLAWTRTDSNLVDVNAVKVLKIKA